MRFLFTINKFDGNSGTLFFWIPVLFYLSVNGDLQLTC